MRTLINILAVIGGLSICGFIFFMIVGLFNSKDRHLNKAYKTCVKYNKKYQKEKGDM